MAKEQFASVGPLAAGSATAIRTASTIAAAGPIVLNGTLASADGTTATMDNARQVLITFAGNETGHNYFLTGTLTGGGAASETIAGTTAGIVTSKLSYKTVSFSTDSASTGNVSIGTNGVAESGWIQFDRYAVGGAAVQLTASGTVNYTLQQTLDDP